MKNSPLSLSGLFYSKNLLIAFVFLMLVFTASGQDPFSNVQLWGMTHEGGSGGGGTIFKINANGTNLSVVHNFDNANGGAPRNSLIQTSDGTILGMAQAGGSTNNGVIFKINENGSGYNVLHEFEGGWPMGSLIQASNGFIFGMNLGSIFRTDADGTNYVVLHNFDNTKGTNVAAGSLMQAADGALYGMTNSFYEGPGSVFKINADGTDFTVLSTFDSLNVYPWGAVTQGSDGALYGMTAEGGSAGHGSIFKINSDGSNYNIIHNFNEADGRFPYNGLTAATDGWLYGMTYLGGAARGGTLFKIKIDGSGFTVLHQFTCEMGCGSTGKLIIYRNRLFGYTTFGGANNAGVIFSYDLVINTYHKLAELNNSTGANPMFGQLLLVNPQPEFQVSTPTISASHISFSNIFTTSMHVAFKPGNGSHRLVVMKAGSAPAFFPEDNTLYSGDLGNGESVVYNGADSLFSLALLQENTEYFIRIFEFNSDGTNTKYKVDNVPLASVRTLQKILTVPKLLALTSSGGTSGYGTIVSVNPDGSDFTVLYNFALASGGFPLGTLVQSEGSLFGMTRLGGAASTGTIFKINPDGSDHTVLQSFNYYLDGAFPESSLTLASNGSLYGMNYDGGISRDGTIFKINTDGNGFSILHNFDALFDYQNGANPRGILTQLVDGSLVGVAEIGGQYGGGIIFKIHADGSEFMVLHNFTWESGAFPMGSLILGADGSLFGMTYKGGSSDYGTIYKINDDGSNYTVLHKFSKTDGSYPLGSLVQATDGSLFGMTRLGGASDMGTIFKINEDGSNHTVLHNFNGIDGASPQGGSLIIYDNKLFGLTCLGGLANTGVIFSYDLASSKYDKFRDLNASSGNKPRYGTLLLVDMPPSPPLNRPTLQASNISFSDVLSTSMTVSFNPGNGTGRLVVMRTGAPPTLRPTDNTTYTGALGHGEMVVSNNAAHTFNVSGLESYRTYYFTVFEYMTDSLGNIKYLTENAPVRSQRTRILPAVYLIKPGNGTVGQYVSLTLKANLVDGATTYTFEVSRNANFSDSKILTSNNVSQLIDSLQYNTLYYAHVKTNLRADYGKVTTFTTRTAESLACVTSPANNAVNVPATIAVASNNVPYVSEYTIQLSESSDFSTIAFERTGPTRILHFTGLKSNTTYHSRVHVNLSSVFGPIRTFTTAAGSSARISNEESSIELMGFAVKVFPNPFQEKFSLYIESSRYSQAEITLMDLGGRTIHQATAKTNSNIEIDKPLASGVYCLKVNAGGFNKLIRVVRIQ
jgi:uncharacterized repeat protein (TIGR03803 family)